MPLGQIARHIVKPAHRRLISSRDSINSQTNSVHCEMKFNYDITIDVKTRASPLIKGWSKKST